MPSYELDALPGDVTIQPSVDGSNTTLNAADNAAGAGGAVQVGAGDASAGTNGGDVNLTAGNNNGDGGAGGQVWLQGGAGADGYAAGAAVYAFGGNVTGNGGAVRMQTGSAGDPGGDPSDGGDIQFQYGVGDSGGRDGLLFLALPTADPAVAGAAWNNAGTVKISTG